MSYTYTDELYHFGIKGMKWGVRRYQNEDGSLTAAGRERYGSGHARLKDAKNSRNVAIKNARAKYKTDIRRINDETGRRYEKIEKNYKKGDTLSDRDIEREKAVDRWADSQAMKAVSSYENARNKAKAQYKAAAKKIKESPEYKAERNAKIKKALVGAAVVGGVALAAYGGYKLYKVNKDYKNRIGTGKFLMDRIEKSGQMMREDAYWAKQATLDASRYSDIAKSATTDYARRNAMDDAKEAIARANRFYDSSKAYERRNSLDMQTYVENLNKLQENPIYKAKANADLIRRNGVVNTAYDAASRGARSAYETASRGARGVRSAYDAASRGARDAYNTASNGARSAMRNVRENNPIARAQESARRDRTTLGVMASNDARRARSGLSRAKEDLNNQRNTTIRRRRRRNG